MAKTRKVTDKETGLQVEVEVPGQRAIAHHEAGHAVAAWLLGLGDDIEYGTSRMRRGKDDGGVIVLGAAAKVQSAQVVLGYSQDPWRRAVAAERIKAQITVLMAGPAAQFRFDGGERSVGFPDWLSDVEENTEPGTDYVNAVTLARLLETDPDRAQAVVERCAWWADELIWDRRVWPLVVMLAETLHTARRQIPGGTIRELLVARWPLKVHHVPASRLRKGWVRKHLFPASCKSEAWADSRV